MEPLHFTHGRLPRLPRTMLCDWPELSSFGRNRQAARQPSDGVLHRCGHHAREAEPQLRLTRWISIKRVAGDEGNPRYERAVEQGARADTGDKAAPQVESPVRTRESQDTWRDMPLQRRDHQS